MFVKRLISGVLCLILIILFGVIGGVPMDIFYGVISCIGLIELYRAFGLLNRCVGITGIIATIVYYLVKILNRFIPFRISLIAVAVVIVLVILSIFVLRYPKYKIAQITEAIFGFIYVPVFMCYICQTRDMPGGVYMVWLIFLSSWGTDTCAYCVGRLFGKHKIAPLLSPGKSVEGAIGGVIGAAFLTCLVYGIVLRERLGLSQSAVIITVIAVAFGAYISMIGDLCASAIKREFGIKDFGRIIPGHGGILDRMDSVLFTAPMVYIVLQVMEIQVLKLNL